jgi:acetyltransferase-like isoleucine patch superfamily enzyme
MIKRVIGKLKNIWQKLIQVIFEIDYQLKYRLHFIRYHWQKRTLERKGNNFYENLSFNFTKIEFDLKGKNNVIIIGKKVKGSLLLSIRGSNHEIKIDDEVVFYGNSLIDTQSSHTKIHIGKQTSTLGSTFTCREPYTEILIGEGCLLAEETRFWCTDFHSVLDKTTGKRTNYAQKIVIADHVWIGYGVRVLKNTSIGQDSIIGTGSVVTRDIPENVVAMGIPATPVKKNISWDKKLIPNIQQMIASPLADG